MTPKEPSQNDNPFRQPCSSGKPQLVEVKPTNRPNIPSARRWISRDQRQAIARRFFTDSEPDGVQILSRRCGLKHVEIEGILREHHAALNAKYNLASSILASDRHVYRSAA